MNRGFWELHDETTHVHPIQRTLESRLVRPWAWLRNRVGQSTFKPLQGWPITTNVPNPCNTSQTSWKHDGIRAWVENRIPILIRVTSRADRMFYTTWRRSICECKLWTVLTQRLIGASNHCHHPISGVKRPTCHLPATGCRVIGRSWSSRSPPSGVGPQWHRCFHDGMSAVPLNPWRTCKRWRVYKALCSCPY